MDIQNKLGKGRKPGPCDYAHLVSLCRKSMGRCMVAGEMGAAGEERTHRVLLMAQIAT